MTFTKKLKTWLKSNKLTQQQGAIYLNVPFRTFQDWLAGRTPHKDRQAAVLMRLETMEKISKQPA